MGWRNKIPKPLRILIEQSHRWAGAVSGPPGSGKTTFMSVLGKLVPSLYVGVKETPPQAFLEIPEEVVKNRLSSILHFTSVGIKPAFDALTSQRIERLEDIENILGRFKPDVAEWVMVRVRVLLSWMVEDGKRYIRIPLALHNYDELARRLVVGVLYVSRPIISHIILLDDTLAFVTDIQYREAFSAMMRPYMFSVNRYLDSRELLLYNPVVITPGGSGVCAAA